MRPGRRAPGFSMIELMVTIALIAILMALATPYFGNATGQSRERGVVQKLVQDFQWARGAAGAADASVLVSGATAGSPTVTLTLNADCSWTTTVSGATDANHSMTTAALASTAPNIACTYSAALPATFTFTAQGGVNNSGTVTYTGASTQSYPLQILASGLVLRLGTVTGTVS